MAKTRVSCSIFFEYSVKYFILNMQIRPEGILGGIIFNNDRTNMSTVAINRE